MDAAVAAAAEARERLRASFASGRTRPAAWREAQLRGLLRMAAEMEDDICAALRADLAKPQTESYVHEVYTDLSIISCAQIIFIVIIILSI